VSNAISPDILHAASLETLNASIVSGTSDIIAVKRLVVSMLYVTAISVLAENARETSEASKCNRQFSDMK
jgi:hypothetical protein